MHKRCCPSTVSSWKKQGNALVINVDPNGGLHWKLFQLGSSLLACREPQHILERRAAVLVFNKGT